jgi:hypothetical protein
MKEIPNKSTALPPAKTDGLAPTYADLLRNALDFPPQGGFTLEEMRKRGRIDKALTDVKAGDVIKLEDADYTAAQEVIRAVRWNGRSPELLAFAEAFGVT